MDALHFKSATELAWLIKAKKIGALELIDVFLKRVENYNPKLNGIIWMDPDKARVRAKAADAALARARAGGRCTACP